MATAVAAVTEHEGGAEVVFLCVPTPMGVGGVADLSAVESVVDECREQLPAGCIVLTPVKFVRAPGWDTLGLVVAAAAGYAAIAVALFSLGLGRYRRGATPPG